MDKANKRQVKEGMVEAITTQIETNDPPVSRATFYRLCDSGYSEEEAKGLMANILVHEMFMVMKHKEAFDLNRYTAMLSNLPRVPQ